MEALWLRDPMAILARDADGGVVVRDGRIVECVSASQQPRTPDVKVFDAREHVVVPGLINTHHHLYQTLTRAHPQAINKALFPWLQALYPVWANITAEALRDAVTVGLAELLLSGCTTAADHHYLFPRGLESAVDIEVDVANALGIRMTVLRGSMNLSEKDGGLPPDSVVQDADTILADCERVLSRYHDTNEGAQIQIALAPCSPFSVSMELMRSCAELAEQYDCRLHTHLAETADENEFCLAHYGCRPLELLENAGWLQPRTWLAHGIHFTDEECARLGHHRVGVCHCPTSNATLASGFCPTEVLQRHGAPIGLGVDGSASNDSSNMMEAIRHALMVNRLSRERADTFTHIDALEMATAGSAACLGRDDIGMIATGKQADLAMFKLDELRFAGAHDPLAALVLCGAHHADRVMVAGAWRVIDGAIPGLDIAALTKRQNKHARQLANS